MTALPRNFNAADYFVDRNVCEGRGNRIAIECGGHCVTYEDLLRGVNRLGHALRDALGVRMEERVLLLLPDIPEFAYSFFGAIKIGAVPVPVNTVLRPDDYLYLLNDSRARVLIVSDSLLPQVEVIRTQLRFLHDIVVVGNAPLGSHSFAELCSEQDDELQAAETTSDDVAFWLYSSGSTGAPKGCVHLQRDMVACAEQYARAVLGITAADRCFSVAKLFFAYGLGNALYFPFAVGATSVLWPGPPTPANIYDVIERYRPTLFFSVPTSYAQMLSHHRASAPDFDLSSVRFAVSAGEALPAALFHRFQQRFGVKILDGIGSTEVLHIFISNRPDDICPGSSGRVVPGYEARLVDEHGAEVSRGEIGNLMIKGDSTCARYWNQQDRTRDTIQGAWIRTGDKYYQDEEGYFWYAGRADDMLKVNGVWVSPVEIENALIAHTAVNECAVVGHRDEHGLEKPLAYVVLSADAIASSQLTLDLQAWIGRTLPSFKCPRWFKFVEELPKTATGKLQRFKLRETAA